MRSTIFGTWGWPTVSARFSCAYPLSTAARSCSGRPGLRVTLHPSFLGLLNEGLAVPEQLGGLCAQAATDAARVALPPPTSNSLPAGYCGFSLWVILAAARRTGPWLVETSLAPPAGGAVCILYTKDTSHRQPGEPAPRTSRAHGRAILPAGGLIIAAT